MGTDRKDVEQQVKERDEKLALLVKIWKEFHDYKEHLASEMLKHKSGAAPEDLTKKTRAVEKILATTGVLDTTKSESQAKIEIGKNNNETLNSRLANFNDLVSFHKSTLLVRRNQSEDTFIDRIKKIITEFLNKFTSGSIAGVTGENVIKKTTRGKEYRSMFPQGTTTESPTTTTAHQKQPQKK